jgi:pyruvate formate lyase activating enzyme
MECGKGAVYTIYSSTGCIRCKLVMQRLRELSEPYQEHDIKAEGKEAFQQFYTAQRKAIYRGPDGIEFPILTDGHAIFQGLGPALARLQAGERLRGFFRIGCLHKEWLDGISVSGGPAARAEDFLAVLRFLRKHAMKLEVATNGKNADLLGAVVRECLADRLIMTVLGPPARYAELAGEAVGEDEVRKSIQLVAGFPERQFQTVIAPVRSDDGRRCYLTPDEIAETAARIEQDSGSKQQPYLLRLFRPPAGNDAAMDLPPMESGELFPYRSRAREFQVKTEIEREA